MIDFSAALIMLPPEGRRRPLNEWRCRLKRGDNYHEVLLVSRSGFFLPRSTTVVYVTLANPRDRSLFEPGTAFELVDNGVEANGVVETGERLEQLFPHGQPDDR